MTHVRTQIRHRFRDVIDTHLPQPGYAVFASRKFARNHRQATAIVDISITNVAVSQQTMGDERTHVASLFVRVQRSAKEDSLDDLLDADEVLITEAIEQTEWDDLLEEEPELVEILFAEDSDSENTVGAIMLRYDVEYRIDKTNPQLVEG